jgi:periplasmic divalent cation tolerance protein
VNILGGVKSRYWWKGKIEEDDEALLLLKTDASRVPKVIAALGELHPYDTPELLSLPVESGAEAYLRWVSEETGGQTDDAP